MKKTIFISLLLLVGVLVIITFSLFQSKTEVATKEESLTQIYTNNTYKFSIELPKGYIIDENYVHQISPERNINGVKFTIPPTLTEGTNLSKDTALTVESIPNTEYCTAELFTDYPESKPDIVEEGSTTYSYITSTDAGAGNRYEEMIYTLVGSNPCMTIRYFIHYGAIQNYPETIKEFDKQILLDQFESITRSLKI